MPGRNGRARVLAGRAWMAFVLAEHACWPGMHLGGHSSWLIMIIGWVALRMHSSWQVTLVGRERGRAGRRCRFDRRRLVCMPHA